MVQQRTSRFTAGAAAALGVAALAAAVVVGPAGEVPQDSEESCLLQQAGGYRQRAAVAQASRETVASHEGMKISTAHGAAIGSHTHAASAGAAGVAATPLAAAASPSLAARRMPLVPGMLDGSELYYIEESPHAAALMQMSAAATATAQINHPKRRMQMVPGMLDGSELYYIDESPHSVALSQLESHIAKAVTPTALAGRSQKRMPMAAGMMDGSELYYAVDEPHPMALSQGSATPVMPVHRNKVPLMLIDMFPPLWMAGLDRLYLGDIKLGLAKMAVCFSTCGVGGLLWGAMDFAAVMSSALRQDESISRLGMDAVFGKEGLQVSFYLAILDLIVFKVMLAVAAMRLWEARKAAQMAQLCDSMMHSPEFAVKPVTTQAAT